MTTWLITGCSSGLGRHLAEAVLQLGENAVVTARNVASVADFAERYPTRALPLALDVGDSDRCFAVVREAEARFGGVDRLVNNAGHGYRSAIEEGEDDAVAELFATNFFGPMWMIKAVLPGMRARRHGVIVNVSSIAGRRAAPGSGYYAASKFAIEGASDSLRKEVEPLGIKVIVVEPGAFRTDFAGRSLLQTAQPIADYVDTAGRRRKEHDVAHGNQQGDPARGARAIIDAVAASPWPFRLLLGSDALAIVREELEAQSAELERWVPLSGSTDYPA